MRPYKLVSIILNAVYELNQVTANKATSAEIIAHCKPISQDEEKQLKKAIANANYNGLIESYKPTGQVKFLWKLTNQGRSRVLGKELQLSQPVEKITPADVDKAIQQYGGLTPTQSAAGIGKNNKSTTGATLNTQGQLIIWNGQDQVIFNPPEAADLIAFIANQLPWIQYCKQHGGVK